MGQITPEALAELKAFAPKHYELVKDSVTVVEEQPEPAESPVFTLTLDAKELQRKLTVAEVEEIEDITNLPFSQAFTRMKGLTALVWIMRRKEDPKFTLKKARAMTLGEMNAVLKPVAAEGDDDPLGDSASPTA
jgi:hypothetical protein